MKWRLLNFATSYVIKYSLPLTHACIVIKLQLIIYKIVSAKRDLVHIIKKCSNRYTCTDLRNGKRYRLSISILHTTPFLYVNLYFGVLHKLRVDVMRLNYPWGSKLPSVA